MVMTTSAVHTPRTVEKVRTIAKEIYRADDITADPEALMGLPVRATILGRSGETSLYGIAPKTKSGSLT